MRDKILLKGMIFYGHHGVSPQERKLGQPFVVDLELELDLTAPALSDNLGDTVDYSRVYQVVRGIVEGPSRNLLENLAHEVAQNLIQSFSLEAVRVRVAKPHVPIKGGILESAGVEVYRQRGK